MKVLLVSDVQRKGGAGIAADRLARALVSAGHAVTWATPHPDSASEVQTINLRDYQATQRLKRRLSLALAPSQRAQIDTRSTRQRLEAVVRDLKPDVVNVHNLHGAGLPPTLPAALSRTVPVVWTLHDMWAFTGTCAYAMGCRQFESSCDASCRLAQVYPASPADRVGPQFQKRHSAFQQAGRLAFASPSQWLADEAKRGMLSGFEVHAIPNSIELDRFFPVDRGAAREALGLPLGRPVLVTAASPGDPRKGASVLHGAMTQLNRPNTILLQLGGEAPAAAEGRWDHRVLTGMHDSRLLRLAYSAADAHLLPTLADNLPNTLLEAAACGTPSIGSDVGGVGEVVGDGEAGRLVEPDDAGALASAIADMIDLPGAAAAALRGQCRRSAESRFTPGLQARRYTDLFKSLQGSNRRAA